MIINNTKCEQCLKEDVCGKKGIYALAVHTIGNANTSDEEMAIHEARANDAIEVKVSCKFFFGIPTSAR